MKPRPPQSAFKYKSLAELNRDLPCIVGDRFFAPTVDLMNDPGEAILGRDEIVDLDLTRFNGHWV